MKNYKILGFIAGAHSCGASYIVDGKVVAVIEEERLTRIKPYVDYENDFERYPNESIKCLIERYGLKFDEVDYFTSFFPIDTALSIFKAMFNYNIPRDKYIQIDHHESHAILSYYLSNFQEDTLVFCADASGGTNGHSSKTYLGSGGKMYYLDGINTKRKSLGHFYAALTEFLGYKRLKDEGKVVGLSGHGAIWWDLYRAWDSVITIEGTKTSEDNHHIELGGVYYDLYSKFYEFVGSKYWKNKNAVHNIAYTGQRLFEDKVIELIQNLHKKAPHTKKLALSGGIFANVKLNKRINELDEFDEIFVLPPMGDEGLAFGCAMGVMARLEEGFKPFKANDMFLGNEYSKEEVLASSKGFGRVDLDVDLVATLLQQKKKSRYSAEFMTLLVDTKEEWKGKIPTVVHPIDKTARIQIVTSSSNPLFYNILKAYKKNTGVGILVNTSFNVHNEPIVESPDNAFNHLRNGIIDYLVTPYGIFTKGKSID